MSRNRGRSPISGGGNPRFGAIRSAPEIGLRPLFRDHQQSGRLGLCLILLLLTRAPALTLAAVGDVLLSRTIPDRVAEHGVDWLWHGLGEPWRSADLRFINLECPIAGGGRAVNKRFSFRADPRLAQDALAAGRVDICSVANNHTYDYHRPGLAETLMYLEQWQRLAVGAGTGRAGAVEVKVQTVDGLRLGWLAYTAWTPEDYLPSDGVALATLDEGTLTAEVRAARAGCDRLIVSVHWGKEYAPLPTKLQVRVGRQMIDAGADVLLGHHPHVAQPIEEYGGGLICYSLGNAIFDRSGDQVSGGLLVRIDITAEGVKLLESQPLTIEDGRPRREPLPDLAIADLDGRLWHPYRPAEGRFSLLVFALHDCPVSNQYAPEIQSIANQYGGRVDTWLAQLDRTVLPDTVRDHAREYGYTVPVILDSAVRLPLAAGVTIAPTAVVVGPGGWLLYRGRIDDRFIDWTRSKPAARQHDLREALDALLAGEPVPHPRTQPVGCDLDLAEDPAPAG